MVTANRDKLFQKRALEQAFDFFDRDKTGFLEVKELRELLGGDCDKEEMAKIMEELDGDGDRQVSKEEFMAKLMAK